MAALWIILGLIVIVAIGLIVSYNRFVSQRQLIKDAWANIDTELRRRYDLIPNLVETVKGYASHEREVFEEVARTRSMAAGATGTPAAQAAAEGPFMAALGKLFAVAEAYPGPEGEPELPGAADRALATPRTACRPPAASTTRTSVSSTGASQSPLVRDRGDVPLRAGGVLRDRGCDPRGRARRRSTSRHPPAGPWCRPRRPRRLRRRYRRRHRHRRRPGRLRLSRRAPFHRGARTPRAEGRRSRPSSWRAARRW